MNSSLIYLWTWLVDFLALATVALMVACVLSLALRSPSWRLMTARACLIGVAILAVAIALPVWPRASLQIASHGSLKSAPVAVSRSVDGNGFDAARSRAGLDSKTSTNGLANTKTEPVRRKNHFRERSEIQQAPISVSSQTLRLSSAVFLALAGVVVVWLWIGGLRIRRLVIRSTDAPARCYAMLEQLTGGSGRRAILLISAEIRQPLAVGLRAPRILLPKRFLERAGDDELRAVIAHEWSHIQRGDLCWLALNRVLMVLLFAHPCFWWLRRRCELDQELVADRAAAEMGKSLEYAEMLIVWARQGKSDAASAHALAMLAKPHRLKRRVKAMLKNERQPESPPRRSRKLGICGAMTLMIVALAGVTMHTDGKSETRLAALTANTPRHAKTSPPSSSTRVSSPIKISLPEGITLELVGVRDHPCVGQRQWTAAGMLVNKRATDPPAAAPPLAGRAAELMVRVDNPQHVDLEWIEAASSDRVDVSPPDRMINGAFAVPLVSDARVADIRIKFGLGDWRTIGTSGCDLAARDEAVSFAPCRDDVRVAVISVFHKTAPLEEMRVLALDENGTEHRPTSVLRGRDEITATFADLPMEQVQEFFVQSRQQGWVEFRNVSLAPGQQTAVEVATDASG